MKQWNSRLHSSTQNEACQEIECAVWDFQAQRVTIIKSYWPVKSQIEPSRSQVEAASSSFFTTSLEEPRGIGIKHVQLVVSNFSFHSIVRLLVLVGAVFAYKLLHYTI